MSIQVSTPSPELVKPAKVDRQSYVTTLLDQRSPLNPAVVDAGLLAWLQPLRDQAADRGRSLSIPTTRDEEWRFTDLSALVATSFNPAAPVPTLSLEHIRSYLLPETQDSCLVFVNGVYSSALSTTAGIPGDVIVGNLAHPALSSVHSRLSSYMGQQQGAEDLFTVLNTASFTDAAVVWVPQNQVVDTPIHLLFVSVATGEAIASYPRCVVIAEPNSSLTILEEYVTIEEGRYFTDPVTEIWIDDNAQVTHHRIQRDSLSAIHMGKTAIAQSRSSRYWLNAISLGGQLSRHQLDVFQMGEQTETVLNGLTLIGGEQLSDTHSLIAYSQPHGTSRQLHKCIVDDRAHAVFSGKVNVPQAAQLTDAGQLNRNLLLSSKGRVDTKPQLEIVADNVRCTHGATVSQLDADEVFYLQSRGIDTASAQSLLIYGFAAEVLDQISVPSLKDALLQRVAQYNHPPRS